MKKHIRMLAYILLVFIVLFLFGRQMQTESGTVLSELEFVTYDNVLYSPEELHTLTEEQQAEGHVGWDYDYHDKVFSRVRTNQMILKLVPGKTYGLYTEQLTYAARLWIDGELVAELGKVSDSPEGFVPKTGSVVVYFTADEETEIVMQRCNFNHAKWNAVQFYYGPQEVITRQVQSRNFREISYLGFLAALGIINLGMFAGMPDSRRFLYFSMACFATMIHQSLQDPKVIMQVFPNLAWNISYRTEGITLILLIIFIFLFLREVYGNSPWNFIDPLLLGLLCLQIIGFLFVPTLYYTQYTVESEMFFGACCASYCILILIRIIRHRKEITGAQSYYLVGIILFILAAVGAITRTGPAHVDHLRIGLILFELTSTLTLALEFTDVQKAYQHSKEQETQLRQMNESMEQTKELQENFMAIMNHEMRTPLTVIAGYADLSARKLEEEEQPDEEMIRNLKLVKQEALRLGRIVKNSDESARMSIVSGQKETVSIRKLFVDARDFCLPIVEKNKNRIVIDCSDDLYVSCIYDNMLQALYNLILNASKHTRQGTIRLKAEKKDEEILIYVIDNGGGMNEETKKHAFESGYTTDGGRGLGLALCKEIVEKQNGRIWIESSSSKGTVMAISLPAE